MKLTNPLVKEFTRLKRYSLLLVVVLATALALTDYLWSLTDRQQARQSYLNIVTKDLEHQLDPLLYFSQQLQRDINRLFTQTPEQNQLEQSVVIDTQSQSAIALSSKEVAVLNAATAQINLQQRGLRHLQSWAYVSRNGALYQPQQQNLQMMAMVADIWQQLKDLPTLEQQQDNVLLLRAGSQSDAFILAVPVRQLKQQVGYLLLKIDVLTMFQQMLPQQKGDTLMLLDKVGNVLLAMQDGQPIMVDLASSSSQLDSITALQQLPYSLHLKPHSQRDRRAEVLHFLLQMVLYLIPLLLLSSYCLWRYKRRTLAPFGRLLTHVGRLDRNDLTGVRHVPLEWESVFYSVRQLKSSDVEKNAD